MPRFSSPALLAAALVALTLVESEANAAERHFAFSREPSALEPGDAKLSSWTTARAGREDYYSAIDQRLQFGLGLAPNFEASLYWNFSTVSQQIVTPLGSGRASDFSLSSVSSEWRYKFTDIVADALGFALSLEGGYSPELVDVGGRALLGKQLRDWLVVGNLAGAQRWESAGNGTLSRQAFSATLGVGYYFSPMLVGGVEVLDSTLLDAGKIRTSAIYAGPTLAYAAARYYLVVSAAPQVFAPKKESDDGAFDLVRNERVWARLVLGFRL